MNPSGCVNSTSMLFCPSGEVMPNHSAAAAKIPSAIAVVPMWTKYSVRARAQMRAIPGQVGPAANCGE